VVIKSVENLIVGDTFKIGNTPVVVTQILTSRDFRATYREIDAMTLYSDGGKDLKMILKLPKSFLIELFDAPPKPGGLPEPA
jgi:hypothetical protein